MSMESLNLKPTHESFEDEKNPETSIETEDKEKSTVDSGIKKKNPLKKMFYVAALSGALLSSDTKEKTPTETPEHMLNRAKHEMVEKGITSEQKTAYKPGLSDLVYRAIGPTFATPGTKESWKEIADIAVTNLKEGRHTRKAETIEEILSNKYYEQMAENPGEEDSWRLYLGFPQKYNTYKISEYRPKNSKENKYYYQFADENKEFHGGLSKKGIIKFILDKMGSFNNKVSSDVAQIIVGSRTMLHFQWSKGEDEKGPYLAYYDIWDLDVPLEKNGGFIGKPFEIYGRIYYNKQTFEIIK